MVAKVTSLEADLKKLTLERNEAKQTAQELKEANVRFLSFGVSRKRSRTRIFASRKK